MAKPPKKHRKIPAKTRRLTRQEAERLGVSYTAKRRVDASLQRITKRTALYTDREIAEARAGVTKEDRTIQNRLSKKNANPKFEHYVDLTKKQLIAIIKKKAKGRITILQYQGQPDRVGERYGKQQNVWLASSRIRAGDALYYLPIVERELGFSEKNKPVKYGIIIYAA
jgi:hypothetical protein